MIKINKLYYITFFIILFIFCIILYSFEKKVRVDVNFKINFLDKNFTSKFLQDSAKNNYFVAMPLNKNYPKIII